MKLFILAIFAFVIFERQVRGQNASENELRCLQRDLAKQMKIDNYKEMEMTKFKKMLEELLPQGPSPERNLQNGSLCFLCRFLMKQLQQRALTVTKVGEILCNIYITLSTWTVTSFCADVINQNMPTLEYIVNNSKIFSPEYACSVLLQIDTCYSSDHAALTWKIPITPLESKKIPQVQQTDKKTLRILHITDLHLTPDYEIGGVSDCGYPICCKQGLGNPIRKPTSGKWGDYNCDIPLWTFVETLRHINKTHTDIDMIYFTGDIVDHSMWEVSQESNTNLIYFGYKTFHESFGSVPVFAVIGNHEAVPLNSYAPPSQDIEEAGFSSKWLYRVHSKLWRTWLSGDALNTVARQGYYSQTINNNFKVIGLNNNICYNLNWWVLYDTYFLVEQLEFLKQELEQSERQGQFVHILMHIPPGNKECIEPFETNYNALIRRFSHIIKGQFYGHTHTDELKVFYDENGDAINMGFNGASLTPYVKYNPNYKIMTVDANNYDVLDIDSYTFNLYEANRELNSKPEWYKLYSMKDNYGLSSLSPNNFNGLAMDMFTNDTTFKSYWRYYVRDGKPSLEDGCTGACKKNLICGMLTTNSLSPSKPQCQTS